MYIYACVHVRVCAYIRVCDDVLYNYKLPVLVSISNTSSHEVFVVVMLVTGSINSISVQFCIVLLREATVLLKHAH